MQEQFVRQSNLQPSALFESKFFIILFQKKRFTETKFDT